MFFCDMTLRRWAIIPHVSKVSSILIFKVIGAQEEKNQGTTFLRNVGK
jgi:hypothetical protein